MNRLLVALGLKRSGEASVFDAGGVVYEAEADADADDALSDESDDVVEDEERYTDEEDDFADAVGQFEYQIIENGLYFLRDRQQDGEVWLLASQRHPVVEFCVKLRQREIAALRHVANVQPIDVDALRANGGIVPGLLGYFVEEKLGADPNFHVPGMERLPAVEEYLVDGENEPSQGRSRFFSGVETGDGPERASMHLKRFFVAGAVESSDYEELVHVSTQATPQRVIWYTLDPAHYVLYLAQRDHWLASACLMRQLQLPSMRLPDNIPGAEMLEHLRRMVFVKDNKAAAMISKMDHMRQAVSVAIAAGEIQAPAVLEACAELDRAFVALQ